jgi:hypothetical protein
MNKSKHVAIIKRRLKKRKLKAKVKAGTLAKK